MRSTPSTHRTPSVRRLTVLATCVTLGGALAAGVLVPAQAGAATISHTAHAPHTSTRAASVAFTAKTHGGPDRKSFTGITFAGTGKPDTLVIVYYDAPGKPRGLFNKHIAEVTSGTTSSAPAATTASPQRSRTCRAAPRRCTGTPVSATRTPCR